MHTAAVIHRHVFHEESGRHVSFNLAWTLMLS